LELAAGINIVFVAVEYSKSYTHILFDKVYNFPNLITTSFKQCHDVLLWRETLSNLESVEIEGKSTLPQIEKTKIELEKLETAITQEEKEIKDTGHTLCESKSFSSLSLWNFLFAIVALVLSGIEDKYQSFAVMSFYILSIFTLLFVITGWIRGEKNGKKIKILNYSSLSNTIITFITVFIISLLLTIFFHKNIVELIGNDILLHNFTIACCVLIPFFNFVAYLIIIRKKVTYIKKEINDKVSSVTQKCNILKEEVENLVAVNTVKNKLTE
jgi:hypothetical protein